MRKVLGEGRKQRPLKCEFSAARETRVAPLLVIGLAPIPKLPPPHLSIYCFPIQSRSPPSLFPSHLPLTLPADRFLYILLFPELCWSMMKHEKWCWRISLPVAGFCGGLIEDEGLRGWGSKQCKENAYTIKYTAGNNNITLVSCAQCSHSEVI